MVIESLSSKSDKLPLILRSVTSEMLLNGTNVSRYVAFVTFIADGEGGHSGGTSRGYAPIRNSKR